MSEIVSQKELDDLTAGVNIDNTDLVDKWTGDLINTLAHTEWSASDTYDALLKKESSEVKAGLIKDGNATE